MSTHAPIAKDVSGKTDQFVQAQLHELDRRVRSLEDRVSQLEKKLKALEEK